MPPAQPLLEQVGIVTGGGRGLGHVYALIRRADEAKDRKALLLRPVGLE